MRNPPRSCDLHGGFFAPSGLPKPLPLGEVSPKVTERASPAGKSRCAAMGRLFVRAILSRCQSCLATALPSQSGLRPPAPPKGEPLACRSAFVWTLKARRGAKGRALLQRPAASGQRSLSSCRWPRQRSTTVPETSCFARPVGSGPSCQGLPLWESWREAPERAHPGTVPPAARLRGLREFVENARLKRKEFVNVIKMRRRY